MLSHVIALLLIVGFAISTSNLFADSILNTRPAPLCPNGTDFFSSGCNNTEKNLQSILDSVYGTGIVNAVTDQSTIGVFDLSRFPGPFSVSVTVLDQLSAQGQHFLQTNGPTLMIPDMNFGLPNGTSATIRWDMQGVMSIIAGTPSQPKDDCSLNPPDFTRGHVFCVSNVMPGDARYIDRSNLQFGRSVPGGEEFFMLDSLNPGAKPQALVYSHRLGNIATQVVAFEDGALTSPFTDGDYNDFVFKFSYEIPEPSSAFLAAIGLAALLSSRVLRRLLRPYQRSARG